MGSVLHRQPHRGGRRDAGGIIENFGWLFVLTSAGFVLLATVLAFSRFGGIRLGKDGERPEFSTASWVAMMFSAGMGIGLMFYGASEPIMHMSSPPPGTAQAGTEDAARVALEYSYFHWAVHPWAMYAVAGLALAYFGFRKSGGSLISSAFRPLLGDRVDGPIGKSIDILAIFATLFGSAVSLGLGALQINSGLKVLWGVNDSTVVAVVIIAVLTVMFVLSAISGVHRGIQWLSNGNMILAIVLLLFIFIVGPTVFILNTQIEALGGYLASLPKMSFRTGAFGGEEVGLFATLQNLPWFPVTSVVVIILVGLFFVSGADAASVVLGMLSSRGSMSPSRPVVIVWGVLTGLVAAVLLLAGGLNAVKTVAIIAAFPFLLVMIGMCVALVKALRAEPRKSEPESDNVTKPAEVMVD